MKKSSLRKTLLPLLGLAPHMSRAQTTTTSSWGAPFTVDTPSASTDALLPSTHTPSSQSYASFITPPASLLSTAPTGLAIDTSPPAISRATGVTLISGIPTGVSGSSSETFRTSALVTTTGGMKSTATVALTSASASAQVTGAAGGRVYRKMGFVGVVAGAAGVMAW